MHRRTSATFALVLTFACLSAYAQQQQQKAPIAVFGYLPEWRYQSTNIEHACKYTTHLLIFSVEVSPLGDISATERFPNPALLKTLHRECGRSGTKLLLCFGGNGRSGGFSAMALSEKKRARFVSLVANFLVEHGLHGVDFNWEYPATKEEWRALYLLIAETRRVFDATPRTKDLLITVDYYPDTVQERMFAHSGVLDAIDYLHIMAYDQQGAHSTREFAKKAIAQGIQLGLPREKLTLGVPFYARHVRTGEALTYAQIVEFNSDLGEDDDATQDYFFNGVETIRFKTQLALDSQIGGLMIWEVGQDIQYYQTASAERKSLLKAINDQMYGKVLAKNDPSLQDDL